MPMEHGGAGQQFGSGPHFILTREGDIHGVDTPGNRELVRRIHACVQACEGLTTEELENGVIKDMQRVITMVIPILQDLRVVDGKNSAPRPVERAA